ncbi:MAG: hypothetical protein EBV71_06585 [Chitinophagia bacterium]|nr:hypothetical protein [Chitinophagia bacterium]
MGRDLLDPHNKNHFAFITNAADRIGVVTDDYFFVRNLNAGEEQLFLVDSTRKPLKAGEKRKVQQSLSDLTFALFETSRYLIMSNPRD